MEWCRIARDIDALHRPDWVGEGDADDVDHEFADVGTRTPGGVVFSAES